MPTQLSTRNFVIGCMVLCIAVGCSSGYIEKSDPNNNFADQRAKRKAARDQANSSSTAGGTQTQ